MQQTLTREQLVDEAARTLERIERRLARVDKELRKTLVKQVSKYAALSQKAAQLTRLKEAAERRLARRSA
jgi:hypothetical protein